MEINNQPYQLQKSGPESKIVMALSLRILKRAPETNENEESLASSPTEEVKDLPSVLKKQDSRISRSSTNDGADIEETVVAASVVAPSFAVPPSPTQSKKSERSGQSLYRNPSIQSLLEPGSLGIINMTLQYSVQRQRLCIIVHKIKNIPLKDPSNIPDPYVKLYLLPGRSKDSKRKTNTIKDNCNPTFDATFEYLISSAELHTSNLEVTVCTQKGFLSGGSPIIGMIKLDLSEPEISHGAGKSAWFNLLPEFKTE